MEEEIERYITNAKVNDRIIEMDLKGLTSQYWARKSYRNVQKATETVEETFPELLEDFEEELHQQNYDEALELLSYE